MSDETITINKVEMKSILPQLRKWWNEYQSGKLNLDGKINIACVIGERGGRIIMEFEALHTQVEQAEEREKVVTATYQAQQHSYRELEAVYSACVEDKQQAEAENAKLHETLKALFDKIETNEDGWALFGQKAYAAFFTYEETTALRLIVPEAAQ